MLLVLDMEYLSGNILSYIGLDFGLSFHVGQDLLLVTHKAVLELT